MDQAASDIATVTLGMINGLTKAKLLQILKVVAEWMFLKFHLKYFLTSRGH